MPPTKPERRHFTLDLPVDLVAYLDERAAALDCSRAYYIRCLIRQDINANANIAQG